MSSPEADGDYAASFRHRFSRVKSIFRAARFSADDAEDLAQNVLWKAYRAGLEHADGRAENEGWLYTVAKNTAIDEWRRRRAFQSLDEGLRDERPGPDRELSGRRDFDRTRAAIEALPSRMRACLTLAVLEELSYEEIGSRLSIRAKTVKDQVWEARRRLRAVRSGQAVS